MDTNLQKYMAFVKTVETGSFSKAAEALHYSQSGVSRMIADLEKEWNVTLLERGKGGVRLTGDGTKLLPFAKSVCAEYDKLTREVNALSGLEEGLVRVGTIPGTTERIANTIRSFTSEKSGIDIELRTGKASEIEEWILSGEVDFGITRIPTENDFETVFLFQEDFVAVIPLSEEAESVFPVARFMEMPYIRPGEETAKHVEHLFRECDVAPFERFSAGRNIDAVSLVRAGLGATVLSENEVKNASGVRVLPLDVPTTRNIGIAVRSRKNASLAAQELMKALEK